MTEGLQNTDRWPMVPELAEVPRGGSTSRAAFPAPLERTALVGFLVYWLVWMSVLAYIWTSHPELHHGDSFSDANVLNAGRNFDAYGLGLNYGLSTHWATHSPERPAAPYTHYPPGPEWILQGLKACGLHTLSQFRAAALVASGLALLLLLFVFARLTGSYVIAALAAFFYSFSAPFAQYADSLHQFAYAQLTLALFLILWLAYERARAPLARKVWLFLAALVFCVDLWLTFEHIAFVPVFVLGRVLFVGRRRDWRGLVTVALVPVVMVGLRLAHNSVALGGVQTALQDIVGAARFRAALDHQTLTAEDMLKTWQARLGAVGLPVSNYNMEFMYPVQKRGLQLPIALLAAMLLCTWHRPAQGGMRRALGQAILLLLAGGVWLVAMRNHALVHRHVILQLLPGLALLLASLVGCGLLQWWDSPGRAPRRWVGPILAAVVVLGFASQIRESQALNFLADLEPNVRVLVKQRQTGAAVMARAAAGALRDVRRMYFIPGEYPVLANQVGCPYALVNGALPLPLGENEAIWIELWSDTEKQLAAEAFAHFGFPDRLSPPCEVSIVFRAAGNPGTAVDVRYEDGCTISRLRCVPTLDGDSWLVQMLVACPADQTLDLDTVMPSVTPLAADGSAGADYTTRLAWGLPVNGGVVVRFVIPDSQVPAGTRLRVNLWDSVHERYLNADTAQSQLPPDATWAPSGSAFIWSPFPS